MMSSFFKSDPIIKQLKQTNLLQNSLTSIFMQKSMSVYESMVKNNQQQNLIQILLKCLQEKGEALKKLKVMTVWIQIYKITKYDLSDIMINKKIKMFTKASILKNPKLVKQNLEDYIQQQIIVPLYNYFMKLSINEDLYKHCLIGKIPDDEVFRRGTKIRFIWIFKIYNLIYLLVPILQAGIKFLQKFPQNMGMLQICHIFYKDLLSMNSFIIEALEEGSEDNFILMPYFDFLQFYESLVQQPDITAKVNNIYVSLIPFQLIRPQKPRILNIDEDTMSDIKAQVARVKLISFTLKNPRKDCTNLMTEYQNEVVRQKSRILKTQIQQNSVSKTKNKMYQDFQIKYKFLDK